jgi:hypothetical protein
MKPSSNARSLHSFPSPQQIRCTPRSSCKGLHCMSFRTKLILWRCTLTLDFISFYMSCEVIKHSIRQPHYKQLANWQWWINLLAPHYDRLTTKENPWNPLAWWAPGPVWHWWRKKRRFVPDVNRISAVQPMMTRHFSDRPCLARQNGNG